MEWIRRRLTYANVASTLALFLALGGASYAVVALPAASVGTRQLKSGAVTNAKVRAHSLTAGAFARGTLRAGSQGPPGRQGPAGATHLAVVTGRPNPDCGLVGPLPRPCPMAQADCPAGQVATGGGIDSGGGSGIVSAPVADTAGVPRGWSVSVSGNTGPVTAYVICAAP